MIPDPVEPPVGPFVQPSASSRQPPTITERLVAILEVLICSDFPTQLALGTTFSALGYKPFGPGGQLQVGYVVGLSLVDAVVLVGLIVLLLYSHGENPRDVLFGRRPIADEIAYGIPLTLVALGGGIAVLFAIQYLVPWLHSVRQNPLEGLTQPAIFPTKRIYMVYKDAPFGPTKFCGSRARRPRITAP